jgi:hypothetical protein
MPSPMNAQPKARSIWPLPGGSDAYLENLLRILHALPQHGVQTEDFLVTFRVTFPLVSSDSTARSYLRHTLVSLGVVSNSGGRVQMTAAGRSLLRSSDPRRQLGSIVLSRIEGARPLLGVLQKGPSSIRHLIPAMAELGFEWSSDWPLRYRLNWLKTAGLVVRVPESESAERYPQWRITTRTEREARFSG